MYYDYKTETLVIPNEMCISSLSQVPAGPHGMVLPSKCIEWQRYSTLVVSIGDGKR